MPDYIKLSQHAKDMALKRYYLGEDRLIDLADRAVREGYSIVDAPSKEIRKYLKKKVHGGKVVYVYSGYIFIFGVEDDCLRLVTTFRMKKYYLNTIRRRKH